MAQIAVIDSDPALLGVTAVLSRKAGHAFFPYPSLGAALENREGDEWGAALVDLSAIEGLQGADSGDAGASLGQLKTLCERVPVLISWRDAPAAGWGPIAEAGPYGYVQKPYEAMHLGRLLENMLEHETLKREVAEAKSRLRRRYGLKRIVGFHPEIQRITALVERVACSSANVLITGASGTGKSLLARVIHQNSQWSDGEFVLLDCGSLEEHDFRQNIESRVRSTQAQSVGTTFYLENVGVLSRSLQDWLARIVMEIQDARAGSVDNAPRLRFIGSSRLVLRLDEENRHFSRDLYCSLAQVQLNLPCLTERADDIPVLIKHFLRGRRAASAPVAGAEGVSGTAGDAGNLRIAPTVLRLLQAHDWPDNVRELRHVIDQAAAICEGDVIEMQDLPRNLVEQNGEHRGCFAMELDSGKKLGEMTREIEQQCIRAMIDRCQGSREDAAATLGISLATLYRKLDLKAKRARKS